MTTSHDLVRVPRRAEHERAAHFPPSRRRARGQGNSTPLTRLRHGARIFLLLFACLTGLHAAESPPAPALRVLTGEVTNTTHSVTAPVRFELTFADTKISGFLVVEPPLLAGRWPVEGERRGTWCEIVCRQTGDTKTVFQGVLSETSFRANFVVGGEGTMVEYGRVRASVAPKP